MEKTLFGSGRLSEEYSGSDTKCVAEMCISIQCMLKTCESCYREAKLGPASEELVNYDYISPKPYEISYVFTTLRPAVRTRPNSPCSTISMRPK